MSETEEVSRKLSYELGHQHITESLNMIHEILNEPNAMQIIRAAQKNDHDRDGYHISVVESKEGKIDYLVISSPYDPSIYDVTRDGVSAREKPEYGYSVPSEVPGDSPVKH